jgi:hypothetical protein
VRTAVVFFVTMMAGGGVSMSVFAVVLKGY